MRITFIVTKLNFTGGGENHDIIIKIRGLKERGHEVTVVTTFSKSNSIPPDINFQLIEEQKPGNGLLSLQFFIANILKKHAPGTDVFYLINSSFLFGAGWYRLSVRGSKPVVADLNGYADFVETYYKKEPLYPLARIPFKQSLLRKIKHWFRILLERSIGVYLTNRLDAIVIMTKTIAQHYARAGVKQDKITIIPSPHDILALSKQPLQDNPFFKYPKNIFHILFTGRFHFDKGVDILIKAFSQCDCPGAMLHLVGDGPEKAALEEMVNKAGLSERVKFYSWREPGKLIPFYQHASLFVHTARLPEPLIRTTVEAMAFGLPLVATDTCGEDWFKEVAKTFPLGDISACAKAIEAAYSDNNFRVMAKANGIKRAKEFDYRQQIINLDNILTCVYD
ncbi:MAG: glycosyltransferase family 4 protein [Patescibacteria group bacterium]|nr:glycosyltransferase family 4 protein [Patescibacteria group bacterium]